tara:strand:+ start:105 stop:422 length:318 start_codon:yes stop_codon:yes gene_type:complete
VGSTKKSLKLRLCQHKYVKKKNNNCSSGKLDLDNCEIYLLEECPIHRRNDVEQYWIDRVKCVNKNKTYFNSKMYKKNKSQYQLSWGGDLRADNNNLLKIDVNLFQ